MDVDYDIVVVGSGAAGLSAAVYTSRGGHETVVIAGDEPGGQLTLTTDVANYPGFPEGINGTTLMNQVQEQAEKFGATVENAIVESVKKDGTTFTTHLRDGAEITSSAVIVASGASARTLGIPGEEEMMGYGVSTCATCDGAFFRGEDMAVIGGGDAACEEAVFLTKFTDTVYLIHRREGFSAEAYWEQKVREHEDIELVLNTEVQEICGQQDSGVHELRLATNPTGYPSEKLADDMTRVYTLDVGAVFVAIGHTPNTDFLTELPVETDTDGYLNPGQDGLGNETATAVDGLFAAGDVADKYYQQAVTAAGDGVRAALDADEYLEDSAEPN